VLEVAQRVNVPFVGLWLEAPVDVLSERLRSRRADASDATTEVLQRQLSQDFGALDWHRVNSAADPAVVQRRATAFIDLAEIPVT